MKGFLNFFTILGVILLGVAGILYNMGNSFRSKAELTTGTVTGFSVSVDSEDNSESYCPQVRFRTTGGQDVTYFSNFCSSPPAYDVGEKVELYYDPQNPESAQLKGFWSQYLVVTIFACIGLPFAAVGVWIALPSKAKKEKKAAKK
ncbi:MAG TPA: DUF3592 domain-containing protein [Anaerolineales bacterium]|jgi:hypothetical protein